MNTGKFLKNLHPPQAPRAGLPMPVEITVPPALAAPLWWSPMNCCRALSGASVTSTITIPNRAIVLGVSARTVTAITGASSYDCGITGEPTQIQCAQRPIAPKTSPLQPQKVQKPRCPEISSNRA